MTPGRLSPICAALLIVLAALPAAASAADGTARAWLTTGDKTQPYQRIEGLGASITVRNWVKT
jgi:hypothetical protein